MKKILVLCTGNSCRSQMLQGFLGQHNDFEVKSAGIEPHGVNPRAVRVMAEAGIDISSHTSNHLKEYLDEQFDYIITVCDSAKEKCPVFPARAKYLHHSFYDPAEAEGSEEDILNSFREVRNRIREYADELAPFIREGKEPEMEFHFT